MESNAAKGARNDDSKPELEAVLPPRAASAARRRAALERLTRDKTPCSWKIGDRVQVRDKHDAEKSEDATPASRLSSLGWKSGRVMALSPVRVQLDGGNKAYTWYEIQAAPPKRPVIDRYLASQDIPKEVAEDECQRQRPHAKGRLSNAGGRSSSVEKARRARSMSRRRRKKEWEVRSKEREQEEHFSRVLSSESSRHLPLPQVAEQGLSDELLKLRQCIVDLRSPDEDTEVGKGPTSQPLTVSRLHASLAKKDLKLQDLAALPVKERKRLLSDLGHPLPNAVVTQKDFVEFLQQKLWSRRAKADQRLAQKNGETLQRLASTEQAALIQSLLDRVEEAKNALEGEKQTFNLAQLFRTLATGDRKFKIDDLKCLPSKELKKLMEGIGISVGGLTKDDIINQLHRRDWLRRARRRQPKNDSKESQALAQLATGSQHEVIAMLRGHLSLQNEDMPQDVVELDRLLANLHMSTEDLISLRVDELKPIMDRLGLTYPGSKTECLTLLHQQLWSARAVQRQPSGHQLEILERLCRPAKHTAVSCSSVTGKNGCDVDEEPPSTSLEHYDDDLPLPMQYDMFVPQDC